MYLKRDLELKVVHEDGESYEYRGIEEVTNYLSLEHCVMVTFRDGRTHNGSVLPVTVGTLDYYKIRSTGMRQAGTPVVLLAYETSINAAKTGNRKTWRVIPWSQVARVYQPQNPGPPTRDFPHLHEQAEEESREVG